MSGGPMTATKLRFVLVIVMVLIAAASMAGFYFVQQQLAKYATEISVLNASAQAGNDNLQILRTLENRLDDERDAITKAQSIVAQSKQYLYQDQIVKDLARIAGDSGVAITQFDFAGTGGSAGAGTTPQGSASQPGSDASGTSSTGTSSLNSETVNVTIKSPVSYTALMNFIKAIELNPTKMQIASISMTAEASDATKVSPQSFTIKVYVR